VRSRRDPLDEFPNGDDEQEWQPFDEEQEYKHTHIHTHTHTHTHTFGDESHEPLSWVSML
jgi:hypothetical protein